MTFVSDLSREHVAQYCESSLSFWGSGLTMEAYIERNLRHVSLSGGLMRFEGIINERGELLASYKRFELTGCVYRDADEGERSANKKTIKLLGIGAVFTREMARRQGAASEMLQHALQEAKGEGFEAALLFSDIRPEFYERLGFVSYESIDRSISFEGLAPRAALATREFTQQDETFCYEVSLAARGSKAAQLTPTLEEWRFFRWRNAKNPSTILQQDGRDVGCVIIEAEEKTLWVDEWAAPGISEEVMLATLHRLAAERGLSSVSGWFPRGSNIEWKEKPRTQAIPMLYFFDKAQTPAAASFWSIEHF